ncbi:uncharacterized protein LOC128389530 isoform X1 [Panonychus citri]|uniref:uncharacterized protein LOC128389530 isoform X1 n=1 Tax=Panonychus citri TaxID=50023 RepID=UPI002306EE04|nr:uncharacterized protein LOC128389530 isoform X1 [Panonychus citri]
MKSIFFIACASLVIASAIGVTIKGDSCPTPTVPKGINYWSFSYFTKITGWYEIGRTDKTVPNTIRNTIEINHLYPGKVYILNKGTVKEPESVVLWDNQVDLTEGNFSGGSYYDIIEDEEPVSFNINQDGKQATFWMPYYSEDWTAVLASCSSNGDGTLDVKAWYVSRAQSKKISSEVQEIAKSLTGKSFVETCQQALC